MKNIFVLILSLSVLVSCSSRKPIADTKQLMDADLAFSDFSVKHGLQKAFIEFAHDRVVLLKANHLPIVGKQSLIDSYKGRSDSGLVLTWKPEAAAISQSSDLGFTYGIWTLVAKGDTSRGTYLTVWKKNNAGQWKYAADTGNEGLGKRSRPIRQITHSALHNNRLPSLR